MTLPVLFTKKKDIRTHEMIPDMRFIHRRKRETIEDDPEIEKKYSSKSVFFCIFFSFSYQSTIIEVIVMCLCCYIQCMIIEEYLKINITTYCYRFLTKNVFKIS